MKVINFRKKDYLILTFFALIFTISVVNIFYDFLNQIFLDVIVALSVLLSCLFIGFQKNKSIIEKDFLLTILVFMFSFNIIIYLLGLFTGFTRSIYSSDIVILFKTFIPLVIFIILLEIERYILVTSIKHSKFLLIVLTISFIFLDNTLLLADLYNSDNMGIMLKVQQYGLFIVPSVITNILLTYQNSKVGYKSAIVYRLLMELPLYIIPIYPKFGDYILSIIRVTIPSGFIIYLYGYLKKFEKEKIIIKRNIIKVPFYLLLFGFCFTLVYFVCGKFRYQAYVIASGSMIPKINIGDVVIVDKKYEKELEIGDVIAFKRDGKIFCHRINDVIISGKNVLYETKGDNNKDVDQLLINEKDIVGFTNFKIKYIGLPTVWLVNNR